MSYESSCSVEIFHVANVTGYTILKVVSESRVTGGATAVPILVFLGLCSRLRPDVRDRQTSDVRQHHRLMPPPVGVRGHNNNVIWNLTGLPRICFSQKSKLNLSLNKVL